MLSKVSSSKFYIESYVCDFTEKATLPVISGFMLDAASVHAQQRGFGYDDIARDNVAWVLSRLSIEICEYPSHNQHLTIETWIEGVARYFTQRCFRFINQNGREIGFARSIWAAIDVQSRRPVDIFRWRSDLAVYIDAEKNCPVGKMEKIPSAENVDPIMGYTVRYSDIDINKHMNSMKYIEHIIDVFDLSVFREKFIQKFEIIYLAEGKFGDKLKLYKQAVSENEFLVDTKRDGDSICRSRIGWNR